MEQDKFDLSVEIKNYISKIHLKGSLTRNDEVELENHLKDGINLLIKKDLSEEEAFLVTLKRIGDAGLLAEEYNKVNSFFDSYKIRTYSLISLALILSVGTIILFVYDLINMLRTSFLAQTTTDTIVKALSYLTLCIGLLIVLKWGKAVTRFLQKNIEQKPFWTGALLFLLPLTSFALQSILIRYIDRSGQEESGDLGLYNIHDVQYVNFSFYLLIIAGAFATLIWFDVVTKKKKSSEQRSFLRSPILFLILFSLLICVGAGMVRYLHQNGSGFQSSIFFALVYTIGSFSIALSNNENLWSKLFIFSMFGLFLGNLLIV